MKRSVFFLFIIFSVQAQSQGGWEWEKLTPMLEPVSNNAVVEAFSGDTLCIYSFTGIASGVEPSDIHLKSWRYNSINEEWTQLPDVDDFRGKIAAGASTVNNIIYVIGGYHVFDNFNEQTSPKVHRFDADANAWLEDGADLPVPTDDHVQAVWRDSLIYVITGWSQNTNIDDVQIYDPSQDTWTAGTSVPNNSNFKVFGASGTIIGDTIYYYGGTRISGFNFVAANEFRKGVINPENPTEIVWSEFSSTGLPNNYRMACSSFEDEIIWFGGSEIAYNFDGLAYSNNAVVPPHQEIRTYNSSSAEWAFFENSPFSIMDLRGVARYSEDEWVLAGGMTDGAQVTNAVYKIRRATVSTELESIPGLNVFSANETFNFQGIPSDQFQVEIFDLSGRLVLHRELSLGNHQVDVSSFSKGIYLVNIREVGHNSNRQASIKLPKF